MSSYERELEKDLLKEIEDFYLDKNRAKEVVEEETTTLPNNNQQRKD